LFKSGALSFSFNTSTDFWRVFSNPFYHFGILHLVLNLITLAVIGTYVDYLCGKIHVFVVFILGSWFSNFFSALLPFATSNPSFGTSGGILALMGSFLIYSSQLEKRTAPGKFSSLWMIFFILASSASSLFNIHGSINALWIGFLFGALYGISGIYFNFHSRASKTAFISSILLGFALVSYGVTVSKSQQAKNKSILSSKENFKDFQKIFSQYRVLREQFHQKILSVSTDQEYVEFEKWAFTVFTEQLDGMIKEMHSFKSADRNIYELQLKTFNDMATHKRLLWESKNKKIFYPTEVFSSNHQISMEASKNELEHLQHLLSFTYGDSQRTPAQSN
jgi:rhomboid protease GluP